MFVPALLSLFLRSLPSCSSPAVLNKFLLNGFSIRVVAFLLEEAAATATGTKTPCLLDSVLNSDVAGDKLYS
jgi:hypothetical protein